MYKTPSSSSPTSQALKDLARHSEEIHVNYYIVLSFELKIDPETGFKKKKKQIFPLNQENVSGKKSASECQGFPHLSI